MKIKNILKLLLIIYTAKSAQCSFFQPTTSICQPALARKHNALFDTTVSYSFADQAFNTDHKKVPLLQQFGSEDFLKRFIDPTLSQTNTSSWGNILLNAKARNLQYDFCCSYNITDNFFLVKTETTTENWVLFIGISSTWRCIGRKFIFG